MHEMRQLERRLKTTMIKNRAVLFAAGVIALLAAGGLIFLILSSIAALFIIPVPVKIGLMVAGVGCLGYVLYRHLYTPISTGSGLIQTAVKVEQRHPELKGRLIAALQFEHFNRPQTNFSRALMEMTARQALQLTKGIRFDETVSGYPILLKARSAAIVAVLVVAVGFLVPGLFSNALDVYSKPMTRVAPPPGFALTVTPGSTEIVKYSDVSVGGYLSGFGFPDEATIHYRFTDGRWQSEDVSLQKAKMFTTAAGDSMPFGITLKQVRRSFDYYVEAGEMKSETYQVNVVERPRVTNLKLSVFYPDYTGLPPMTLDEDNGSFAALVGSRVALEIEANRPVAEGYLITSEDSSRQTIDFTGNVGKINFAVNESFAYHIRILDSNGEENPDPIEYQVTAVPDEYPQISVLYPGFDLNLDENMMIPFKLGISDDFGFTSLMLKYHIVSGEQRGPEQVAVINFSDKIETEGEVTFNWDLDGFSLLPSDYVVYFFELADNDRISGPKVSTTRQYVARLPSIDEIVRQTETAQEGHVFEAEQSLREQQELVEKMKNLSEQIRKAPKLEWQKRKEFENIVKSQQELADKLDEMAQNMEKSLKELESNNLISEQIMQKMIELQKLFAEVATPEMKEAMKKLAEAMKNMSKEDIEEAMKDFQLSQEEMLKRLERSLALLKKMQIEQKMAAMTKMVEEMLLEQNRVNAETEQTQEQKDNNDALARREQQLQKQMDALKEEAKKLDELMDEAKLSQDTPHRKFAEKVEENQAKEDMQGMERSLIGNMKPEALESGQNASEKLSSLLNDMREITQSLQSKEGSELARKLREAIEDANYLSNKEEDLFDETGKIDPRSMLLRDLAAQQQVLKESVNGLTQRLNELGKESPFLSAEVLTYLQESKEKMQGACDKLGDGQGRISLNYQRDALYNLNKASIRLMEGLNQQKQCNGSSSCNKPMQKMQSLSEQQNQLNQETQNQCNNPSESGLKPAQKQAMKRLAAEQGAIRKSMQELQKEFGNRREILGRLDALGREMKDIEEMLKDGRTEDGELFDRQLRIYSRMLDVQKSLNRRDYNRERQAVTADDLYKASPDALDEQPFQTGETLQDRLNRYLQEGYPRQYEQQIKAYFKALSNLKTETGDKTQ